MATELGFDLDDVKLDIDDCLEKSKVMVNRLDTLNEDIVQYLIQNSGNKQTKYFSIWNNHNVMQLFFYIVLFLFDF